MSEQVVIIQNSPIVVEVVPPGAGNPVTASNVSVVDNGNYYTSTNAEGVLQEIGATDITQTTAINTNTNDIATNANVIGTKVDTAGRMLDKTGTALAVKEDFTSTQYDSSYQTLTYGASIDWDMSIGGAAKLVLTGDALLTNPTNKNTLYPLLEVLQDEIGGRVLSFDTDFVEIDRTNVNTDANSITVYAFVKGSNGVFRGQGKTFSL